MTKTILQQFAVRFEYPVCFTTRAFALDNPVLIETLAASGPGPHKVLCVMDEGVSAGQRDLIRQIEAYFAQHRACARLVCPPIVVPGGESVKNSLNFTEALQSTIHNHKICRQSFVLAIGGGALLDMVGFAAATAHRGVRLVRMPTTALSQDDSGVGVKNSVNAFGKKNFVGTFAPPYAVINDFAFLESLSHRDWIAGIAEAVKVALLKDPAFFSFLDGNAEAIKARDETAMCHAIYRCAELHVRHIGLAGDPFESASSRPLDFGHWSAHKLEFLTRFQLRHGEAVAIGIALDSTYSYLTGRLARADWTRIVSLLARLGFAQYVPELEHRTGPGRFDYTLFQGLEEFREHLGGQLTITLLEGIGKPVDVHEMNFEVVISSIDMLRDGSWALPLSAVCKEGICEELSA